MSSFGSLLLVVACASLLQAGCEAQHHRNRQHPNRQHYYRRHAHPSRRNSNDAAISLGSVGGSDFRPLPVIQINGPDVILGFPDNCAPDGQPLLGTLVVITNNNGGLPPQLSAIDASDALSNLSIHCLQDDDGSQCAGGIAVTSYQFCGPAPTTQPPTSTTQPPTSSTQPPTSSTQ